MIVEVDTPAFEELIDPAAELVEIGSGYQFTEGPVWNPRDQSLYFSDIPGDARWRWSEGAGMELVAMPTFKGNGMAYDIDGSLLVCEQVSSCLTRIRPDGRRELVAWHYEGVYLNSPNDVVVRALDGSIYFTDPDYGRWNDWIGCKREFVRDFKGVYRVPPGGGPVELVVAADEFEQPNGLCFSPDEKLLYINDSPRAEIKVYDVAEDGSLSNKRCSATTSVRARWVRATSTAWSATSTATSGRRVPVECGCSIPRASGSVRFAPPRSAAAWCSAGRPAHAVPDDDHHRPHDAHQGRVGSAAVTTNLISESLLLRGRVH